MSARLQVKETSPFWRIFLQFQQSNDLLHVLYTIKTTKSADLVSNFDYAAYV